MLQRTRNRESLGRRAPIGINDGKGFVFISHLGEIFPSGFLPVSAGNVRRHELITIYRESALFRALRDADQLGGKCGRCEYRNICGGSRARTYAMTGDPFAEEPLCLYQPPRAGAPPMTIPGLRPATVAQPSAPSGENSESRKLQPC